MILLAPFLLLTSAQGTPADAEPRKAARAMLEQLLAEDGDVHHQRGRNGEERLMIVTRPRASDRGGLCRRDRLEIERDGSGAVRKVETTHQFFILAGPGDRPRWDVEGEALESSCAAAGDSDRWFEADDAFDAEAAVVALLGLRAELLKPDPRPGVWGCRAGRRCPDPKAIAERIRPLDPDHVWDDHVAGLLCPKGKYCVAVTLGHGGCDNWLTQLRVDHSSGFRFHSARTSRWIALLHCNDPEISP